MNNTKTIKVCKTRLKTINKQSEKIKTYKNTESNKHTINKPQ